jgi:small-conductance mechanosensitive channel
VTWVEGLGEVLHQLDSIGFDVGRTRVSVWRALLVFGVMIAIIVFARLGSVLARRLFARITKLDAAQQLLGEKLVSLAVWATAILLGVDVLGVDLTALAVFSGAFGLAIGFGLQKTFGNLIAGIILLMDRSIKPGDVIAVSDGNMSTVGQVKKIGIRAVSVVTRDRTEYLIPNENLMVNQVENWSYSSRDVRLKIPLRVAYGTDVELAERLMSEAIRGCARVLANPAPAVRLIAFGENSFEFEIRIWIDDPEEGLDNVRSDILKRVWRLFKDNGVEVPFPQRVVYLAEKAEDTVREA